MYESKQRSFKVKKLNKILAKSQKFKEKMLEGTIEENRIMNQKARESIEKLNREMRNNPLRMLDMRLRAKNSDTMSVFSSLDYQFKKG